MNDNIKAEVIAKAKAITAEANAAAEEIINITKNHKGDDVSLHGKIIAVLGKYGQAHFNITTA